MTYANRSGQEDMGWYGRLSHHETGRVTSAPPPYDYNPTAMAGATPKRATLLSKLDVRGWSPRTKIIAGLCIAALIVGIIVGIYEGVESVENSTYPDYSALNYTLKDTYEGTDFFDNFQYWSATDPADGFVVYLAEANAEWSNLTYASDSSAVIKVDTVYNSTTNGRNSIRIQSKNTYDDGLFVFDILHSPYGCGTWPALWLSNVYDWPTDGEIDVVEAVNTGTAGNQMTLHTTKGCTMNVKRKQTGSVLDTNCYNGTNDNAGCGVQGKTASYGSAFNENGGGVYAVELRDAGIRVWLFSRGSIPSDLTNSSATPDPSTWGEALADFPGTDCDISSHFRNQSIIANIDLCGSWAGTSSIYNDEFDCPGTCTDYVAYHPTAFKEAYWEFKSFKVYQAS